MPEVSLSAPDFLVLATEVLQQGHSLRFRAHGGSMWPAIQDGDLVEVLPCRGEDVAEGDIILYHRQDGRIVLHRVIRVELSGAGLTISTQGDAQSPQVEAINPQQVLGRVSRVKRGNLCHRARLYGQRLLAELRSR